MSDKTNQATPKPLTFDEFKIRYCYEAGDGWRVNALPNKVFDWCQREKSPLLAENEKMKLQINHALGILETLYDEEEIEYMRDRVAAARMILTAALSGEQEGTPLK